MLDSKAKQFSLSPEGKILWQEKIGSPLPGKEIAVLVKGDHPLRPGIEIMTADATKDKDPQSLLNDLKMWLSGYMQTVLEPLMLLGIEGTEEGVVKEITQQVFDSLGVVPREEMESLISKLTPEERAALRQKKIRFGPLLVFIPALTKPASVRLRGLLWHIFHRKALPVTFPADGIVSVRIEDPNADPAFYQAIGYPLYGGRAVRIDMLDRVISAVYDNAKDGKFQAQHQMAEWLGASIEDLYKILEAMGHTKIEEPVPPVEQPVTEEIKEQSSAETAASPEAEQQSPKQEKAPLATFRLKKGKAFQKSRSGEEKPKKEWKNKPQGKDKSDKKPFRKKPKEKRPEKRIHTEDKTIVASAAAKISEDDSPFAILKQLKK